ncbi:alcohol dehydrogenase, putative [Talaromyces islandicus]|uniref:Alcohol dehydrogenase, putative n=1 Tax=Talaromyces islandicus TaxID=28573 RepID=A0A0U1M027_TALIS|nr:alcohol dehydrogenase, putative [Talaromyces islandicus]
MAIEQIPITHTAMVYDQPGKVSIKRVSIDTPTPGPGQILVRLTHTGVCHSDHGLMTNAWVRYPKPTPTNQIGGHEGVGYIVGLGAGTESPKIKLGQRVGIKFVHRACRNCAACVRGAESCCQQIQISGYFTPGTFQEYCVAPADYVTPIPDGLPSHLAAPLLCAGLSAYSALSKSRTSPGDWIVVSGAGGGVGHLACQIASQAFGLRVIGIDVQSKESLVRSCGAELFVSLEEGRDGVIKRVQQETDGIGAAAVLVCTGEDSAFREGLDMLGFNGVLVVVGVQEGKERPIENASPNLFLFMQKQIVGSSVGNYREAVAVMDLARRGIITPNVQMDRLENLQSVFERMEKGQLEGKAVLEIAASH